MRQRCTNPNKSNYHWYGGRGITVCARWATFANFLADMGERPAGTLLERRKNHLGYSKANCYWATYKEQQSNRRSNRWITALGETKILTEWARDPRVTITASSLRERLAKGMDPVTALFTPPTPGIKMEVQS
jgi:hypothetical protein